ncbi:activity-regulated cytoskeleton associated protein 2-like [Ostrinia furnacalis]|uniref:activity-regulated cytoskeleton associated protein 2-like n=1 Tax=Ostrinia furnacalis TaxID=93504 RepID=UPI00103DAB3B|nr:activity-regulated cytoskeleton associated protein 2-like [Ostrinia furnacalis]
MHRRSRNACDRENAAPNPAFPSPLSPTPPTQDRDEHHEVPTSRDTTYVPASHFSTENVASIIESLQRSQTEAFKDLLLSVTRINTSTPAPGEGTLARCKSQFSGHPNESVEAFIDAVEAYSDCAQVSSTNIVRGLAFLFSGDAATWWLGIKNTITSWDEAKENLISAFAFGDRRPPHRIYLQLFASPQMHNENTDTFIARSRSLLSKISDRDVSEKARLDMVYGLLHTKIRQRLRREEFATFQDLLRHARNIEDSQGEADTSRGTPTPRTAPRASTTYAGPRAPTYTAPESAIRAPQPPPAAAASRYPAPAAAATRAPL